MAIQNFLFDQIDAIFDDCSGIRIYHNGNIKEIKKGTKEFNEITSSGKSTATTATKCPHLMLHFQMKVSKI